jgi:ABC-2 type transport system permease protein
LGFYRFTNQTFANKDFVLNCIQYLVDNSGLLTTRNKDVKLRLLNSVRVQNEKTKWQIINILLPIIFVVIGGFLFISYRKKKYTLLPTAEKK